MSPIAPITAVRVAGIRPAMPAAASDPSEDGLEVEAVTEVTVTQRSDAVGEAQSSSLDSGVGQQRFARAAIAAPSVVAGLAATSELPGLARGNARVSTGFDATPATGHVPSPRHAFASPFARAMATNVG